MELQSHQVEIWRYAIELREELGKVDLYDWINEQLDLEIWRSDDGTEWRAEIFLTYGGPTVSIDLDSRYETSTLYHSWGAKPNGEAQTSIELYSRALHDAVNDLVGDLHGQVVKT